MLTLWPSKTNNILRYIHIPKHAYGETLKINVNDDCLLQRRFTLEDGKQFTILTGDANPIHQEPDLDLEPSKSPHTMWDNKPIVHGMLSASLFSALFATHIPGSIYLSQTLKFIKPVRYEQLVTAKITVLSIQKHPRAQDKFIIKCSTILDSHSFENETHLDRCIEGDATILIANKCSST
jgi:acyl dehydratase